MRRRRLPVHSYRRLLAGFTERAIRTGEESGWTFEDYRHDRDVNHEVIDAATEAQAAELLAALGQGDDEKLALLLRTVRDGADRRGPGTRAPRHDERAEAARGTARAARELRDRLRRLAAAADAVALAQELRAQDHEEAQRVYDLAEELRQAGTEPPDHR